MYFILILILIAALAYLVYKQTQSERQWQAELEQHQKNQPRYKIIDGYQPEPQPEPAAQPASQPAERSNISWAEPPRPARVLVLSVCASLEDRMRQKLFSGEDGALLHKMLAAIQLSPQDVHCSTWLKQSAHFNPNPGEEEVQAAWADVYQEWQQCGRAPPWLLGEFSERDDVRRCLQQCAPTPYFVTSHPLRLLKYPQLKRAAWDTLQQLKAELDRINAK